AAVDPVISLLRQLRTTIILVLITSNKTDSNSSVSLDLDSEAKAKLIEIEGLMLGSLGVRNEVLVWEKVEQIGKRFKDTGDWNFITIPLDSYKSKHRV
ncbi:MAG TPA: hypothetical protein VE130_06825, partial [Nitrososphaeraceae archaeon]|nr:hypothetical protein [Nitrososphaeraceae archaeon]